MGRSANSWRTADAWVQSRGVDGLVPTEPKPQRKSRKARWLKIGAIIGFVYSLIAIAAGLPSQQDAFFLGGYILSGVVFFGFVGFIAGVIADLSHRPAKSGSPSRKRISAVAPVIGHSNFIVRHWRGELPLWVSYWVINFLGNFCVVAIPILIAAVFASRSGYYPISIFATLTLTWACTLVLTWWQLVGTWRSAVRYSSTREQQGTRSSSSDVMTRLSKRCSCQASLIPSARG